MSKLQIINPQHGKYRVDYLAGLNQLHIISSINSMFPTIICTIKIRISANKDFVLTQRKVEYILY